MSEASPSPDASASAPSERSASGRARAESAPAVPGRLLGAHMPTAGGLHKSLLAGKAIGCTAVQLFTSSPRQWSHPPLSAEEVAAFHAAREQTGIAFTVAHDSYLINLAAPAADVLERSRKAFRAELDRANQLGIPWVVTHMGAHLDQGEEPATQRLIESLQRVLEETDAEGYAAGVALETTAGQGTGLGYRFEQLAEVLSGVGPHPRLGVCLDTCHVFVAGYDLRDPDAYQQTWAAFDGILGLDKLKIIHANDSKKPLGSRVDRHEHIGEGQIGIGAFARLVTDPRLAHLPIIIETPDSATMHAVNLARLKRLAAGGALGMNVTVYLFGHYSDYLGSEPLEITLPSGATGRDLAALLVERDSRLADLASYCRCAINEEYADLDTALTEGCTVAFIPPMSGG
ncbi:MAG TPA: deoxyribonuclease IV [Chthonomonadaceae bacterium]|nr:deoxyribonuclease IV [Chthonomonadaceae bacterium]